jgi:hypothetical protein
LPVKMTICMPYYELQIIIHFIDMITNLRPLVSFSAVPIQLLAATRLRWYVVLLWLFVMAGPVVAQSRYSSGTVLFNDGRTVESELAFKPAANRLRVRRQGVVAAYGPADIAGFLIGRSYYQAKKVGSDTNALAFLPCLVAGPLSLHAYPKDGLYLLSMGDSSILAGPNSLPIGVFQFTQRSDRALTRIDQKSLVAYAMRYNQTVWPASAATVYEKEQRVALEIGLRGGFLLTRQQLSGFELDALSAVSSGPLAGVSFGFVGKGRLAGRLDILSEQRRGGWEAEEKDKPPLVVANVSHLSMNAVATFEVAKKSTPGHPYVLLGLSLLKAVGGQVTRRYRYIGLKVTYGPEDVPVNGATTFNQAGLLAGLGLSHNLTERLRFITEVQVSVTRGFNEDTALYNDWLPATLNSRAVGVSFGLVQRIGGR